MARIKRGLLQEADRRCVAARLGDLARQDVDVFCWCNRCAHNGVLDTRLLIEQLGPDYPVPEVGARLRCSGCASKDIATRPAWPGLGQVTRHVPGAGNDTTPPPASGESHAAASAPPAARRDPLKPDRSGG